MQAPSNGPLCLQVNWDRYSANLIKLGEVCSDSDGVEHESRGPLVQRFLFLNDVFSSLHQTEPASFNRRLILSVKPAAAHHKFTNVPVYLPCLLTDCEK